MKKAIGIDDARLEALLPVMQAVFETSISELKRGHTLDGHLEFNQYALCIVEPQKLRRMIVPIGTFTNGSKKKLVDAATIRAVRKNFELTERNSWLHKNGAWCSSGFFFFIQLPINMEAIIKPDFLQLISTAIATAWEEHYGTDNTSGMKKEIETFTHNKQVWGTIKTITRNARQSVAVTL